MTATDELRAMLDERGVEWQSGTRYYVTHWSDCERHFTAVEQDSKLYVQYSVGPLTPAQVIAATLGTGVCRNAAPNYLDFLCSECGFVHYHSDENDSGDGNEWNYCPNCGRRIEVTA